MRESSEQNSEIGSSAAADAGAVASPVAYLFACFRVSTQHKRLERTDSDGDPITLTTKLYHLLLTFLAAPGEVISKEDIEAAVWPGQVVTDAALAKQIQRLRKLLAEGSGDESLIETHWGRGYRFVGEVQAEYRVDSAAREAVPSAALPPVEAPRRKGSFSRMAAVGLAVAASVALLAVVLSAPPQPAVLPPGIALLPIADTSGALSDGAAEYLASRLGAQAQLTPALTSGESPTRATEIGSLELFTRREAPVAAVHLLRDDDQYQLWLNLRSRELVASATLRDASIQRLLERAAQWMSEQTGASLDAPSSDDEFAIASYFQGLAASDCEGSVPYLRAAVRSDPQLAQAQLRLINCQLSQGNAVDAAAGAEALLLQVTGVTDLSVALDARFAAARAYMKLGRAGEAQAHLKEALARIEANDLRPLQRLSALAAVALFADMQKEPAK